VIAQMGAHWERDVAFRVPEPWNGNLQLFWATCFDHGNQKETKHLAQPAVPSRNRKYVSRIRIHY